MILEKLYDELASSTGTHSDPDVSQSISDREKFLNRAEDVAKLTIPTIEPRGRILADVAYGHDGAQAIRGFSSTVRKALMPPNRTWFRLQLTTQIKDGVIEQLKASGAGAEVLKNVDALIREQMLKGERAINSYLHRRKVKARIARAITRNIIEGFNVIRVLKDQINVIPLRLLAAFRQHGDLRFYLIKEEALLDVGDYDDRKGKADLIYTLVDPVNQEVWQSANDGEGELIDPEIDGGDYRQYVAFNSDMPDTENYPDSFAYNFLPLFNEIDALVMDLGEAAANAAWAVLGISPGSSISPTEVAEWKSGSAHKFDPNELGWLKSDTKLADFGIINNRLEALKAELRRIFASGIRDRAPGDPTATQILQEVEEIDEQSADLLVNYDETLLGPLATAIAVVEGINMVEIPGVGSAVEAIITTGNSALQRQVAIMRMLQAMGIIQNLDQTLYNRAETFKLTADVQGFEEFTDDVLQVQPLIEPTTESSETTPSEDEQPEIAGSIKQTAGGPQPTPPAEIQRQQNTGRLVEPARIA